VNDRLKAIEEKREAHKRAVQEKYDAQRAIDLEAVFELECQHGDSNVSTIDIPHTDGLPTLVAVKCPKPEYIKRYRDTVKPKRDGSPGGDAVEAAETIASVCVVYPDPATYESVRAARGGVHVQAGLAALKLASGKAADEGKG
jgi:hypothetical protein